MKRRNTLRHSALRETRRNTLVIARAAHDPAIHSVVPSMRLTSIDRRVKPGGDKKERKSPHPPERFNPESNGLASPQAACLRSAGCCARNPMARRFHALIIAMAIDNATSSSSENTPRAVS